MIASVAIKGIAVIALFIHLCDRIPAIRKYAIAEADRCLILSISISRIALFRRGIEHSIPTLRKAIPFAGGIAIGIGLPIC